MLSTCHMFNFLRLSTICRYPDSMLAAMFSGRHDVIQDSDEHLFIDYESDIFAHILAFLRTEKLPPDSVAVDVYHSVEYFNIGRLCEKRRQGSCSRRASAAALSLCRSSSVAPPTGNRRTCRDSSIHRQPLSRFELSVSSLLDKIRAQQLQYTGHAF